MNESHRVIPSDTRESHRVVIPAPPFRVRYHSTVLVRVSDTDAHTTGSAVQNRFQNRLPVLSYSACGASSERTHKSFSLNQLGGGGI
jgi:hypothetical protein